MTYKVICFDADGILIRRKYLFSERLQQEYHLDMTAMQSFFTGVFRECGIGKADVKNELANVIGAWGWHGTVDELLQYWFTKGTEVDDGVLEFVQSLRATDVRTFLTSDQEKYRGNHMRNILSNYFDDFFFSGEIGYRKNNKEFWEYAIAKVQHHIPDAQKDEILLIDDGEGNIETARQFGLSTHHYDGDFEKLKRFLT